MIEGISTDERIEFTFKDDIDPKTIVILKPLSGMDKVKIAHQFTISEEPYAFHILNTAITEVKNSNYQDVKQFIYSLNTEHLTELLEKVNAMSELVESDKKKS